MTVKTCRNQDDEEEEEEEKEQEAEVGVFFSVSLLSFSLFPVFLWGALARLFRLFYSPEGEPHVEG